MLPNQKQSNDIINLYNIIAIQVNPTVASQQPVAVTRRDQATVPKNYIFLSIINLLVCFFVLGTVALIFSLQVCLTMILCK